MGYTVDETGFGNIKVIQGDGFRYGVDAILLSAFACGETGAKTFSNDSLVADLGCGSGIISMVTAFKKPGIKVTGFELQKEVFDATCEAVSMSEMTDCCSFKNIDVADISSHGYKEFFDAVLTNPPYFKKSSAIANKDSSKFIARHETSVDLKQWLKSASEILKNGGDFYMIHRPDRLVDIMCFMREARLEPKEIQFVIPRKDKPANLVLVHAIKGAGAELKMLNDVCIHDEGQGYTDEIMRIYGR